MKKHVEKVQGELTRAGGVIECTDDLGIRTFARRMHKQDSGHYVRFVVKMEPSAIAGLQARLRLNEDIMRFQFKVIDQTVAEAPQAAAASAGR